MKKPFQGPISRKDFQQWLEQEDTPLAVSLPSDCVSTVLKISKTPEFDYLYGVSTPLASGISWDKGLVFCGAYDRRGRMLHLAGSPLITMRGHCQRV